MPSNLYDLKDLLFGIDNFRLYTVANLASSNESYSTSTLCGPSEVAAKVEQLLFDVISKAEMALKQLAEHGTEITTSVEDYNRIQTLKGQRTENLLIDAGHHQEPSKKLVEQRNIEAGSSEIIGPSPLVLNERPGVRYLCCDRFFKCGERNLVAREIWPSDGGCIELNRKELKRFIMNNEAIRCSPKLNRFGAGGSSLEQIEDGEMKHTYSSVHSTIAPESITSVRRGTSSEITLTSITESPETLFSSETTDSEGPNVESSMVACDMMQNKGDQLVPEMKPDGTIVIPGVIHVSNFEALNGVVLELNVLIKSPEESRRFGIKIDCPEFEPRSVQVNGVDAHKITNCRS
uniref:Uncharacterized protein n=1 Tax=Setaria digitata TaxID=48799 RepID=A0A915PCI4_9BILA